MKVYLLNEADFDRLLTAIDRDPRRQISGSKGASLTPVEQEAHDKAHRFYNYQIHTWIQSVQEK